MRPALASVKTITVRAAVYFAVEVFLLGSIVAFLFSWPISGRMQRTQQQLGVNDTPYLADTARSGADDSKYLPLLSAQSQVALGGGKQPTSPITLVVSFFPMPSKRSLDEYMEWVQTFLTISNTAMYVFTTPAFAARSGFAARAAADPLVKLRLFSDVWAVSGNLSSRRAKFTADTAIDPERVTHKSNPDLYAIWASKIEMLVHAAARNEFASTQFVYADMGGFRIKEQRPLGPWPAEWRWLPPVASELVTMFLIERYCAACDASSIQMLEGGVIAGPVAALRWFQSQFWAIFDEWTARRKFAGKDQSIYNTMMQRHPSRFFAVPAYALFQGQCDVWFYFQSAFGLRHKCGQPPRRLAIS